MMSYYHLENKEKIGDTKSGENETQRQFASQLFKRNNMSNRLEKSTEANTGILPSKEQDTSNQKKKKKIVQFDEKLLTFQ